MNQMNRRSFLQSLAATGAGIGFGIRPRNVQAATNLPIGLQLYTVRELARSDFKGTLRKVSEIGYRHFEFAGYGGLDAPALSSFLKEIKVTPCGTHEGFPVFMQDPGKVIAFDKSIGTPYIVVPSMPRNVRSGGEAEIKRFAEDLNRLGSAVKKAGMQLCYHNHSFEFEKVSGGRTKWDVLFSAADPDLVKAEVDIAWAFNAGVDPVELLRKHAGRIKLLHMKDLDSDKRLCPVGTGDIDMESVVKQAREIGVDWYIVEQDRTRKGRDILDEVDLAYRNLAKLLQEA